ncbi:RNA polymerase sigma factor [Microbacterium marinilacus]|uniref:Sigma-70 family RNA polymerase sigma factor n=1 Tax=Microbacterium marinilacus TaxID=415209 RepID=A0ABP7BJV8_9MICO|nr:sigma-70 family RNA polymerase sigma factor [Microbacterium marinilacus]MBY0687686.1 sigma-70 family RNA polymerase sigma factor [Microbacterium marinilacus]
MRLGIFAALGVVLSSAGVSRGATRSETGSDSGQAHAAAAGPEDHAKETAFRDLFDQYLPRVRAHLECLVEEQDEVDELTAEVFVVAWRKLDPRRPMSLPWLLRTADNKLRDRTRSASSRARALDALSRGLQSPKQPLHPLEALALRQALAKLTARERQVVVLTYWDELSAGEVAEALRCSQASVWTTLSRARAKLRKQLEANGGRS